MRVSSSRLLHASARICIEVFQCAPLLQLFIAFFGLPLAGVEVSPWVAAALSLTPVSRMRELDT